MKGTSRAARVGFAPRSAVALAFAMASFTAGPGRAGTVEPFPVSLTPSVVQTDVGAVFTVVLQADSGAMQFNAYEVTIRFDPAVLDFEAVTPGALMLSGCVNAFTFKTETDSSVTYSHSLLCAGVSLDGPGPLSSFRFRAIGNGISPLEIVSDPDRSFFDEGLFIRPQHPTRPRQVAFTNAVVAVGPDPTGVNGPALRPSDILQVRPNPMRGPGEIHFELPRAGQARLEILDVTGRRVFTQVWPALAPGAHRTAWPARDAGGLPLPGGVYLVRLSNADGSRTTKVAVVR